MGRVFKRDGRYAIDYVDHRGKRVRRVVSGDKGVAIRVLSDTLENVERRKAGMLRIDPAQATRPFQAHIDDYLSDLQRRRRDLMYRYILRKRLEVAAFAQEWAILRDATTDSIVRYLRDLADEDKSARTVNQHRADLAAFFGWCVRHGRLEANPCEMVAKSAVPHEKKRRALSVAECRRLMAAAPNDRALVYRFLLYTGLRRAEATQLRWNDVHLDVANPHLELPPEITKSGHSESVPLVADVAEVLREHRDGARDRDRVFDSIPSMDLFRADLKAAEIDEEDARGRKVVLHSLRHSLATMLAQSKVPPAIAMKILRHRDIRLTLEVYTDEGLLPTAAAMESLPRMEMSFAIPTTRSGG
ncbi:MAG: tyrosine-type recombinase/integrase [Phycisphaerales bacterium]